MNRLSRLTLSAVTLGALVTGIAACGDDVASKSNQPADAKISTLQYAADASSEKGIVAAAATSAAGTARSQPIAGAPASGGSTTTANGANGSLATALDRKIIFNATLTLEARDVTSTFNLASRIATNAGGFVEKSTFSGGEGSSGDTKRTASLTIRVPADRYQATLSELRTLDGVTVKTEGSKSSEVTEQYTDLTSRLRNLERTETQYLALLVQAKTIDEILKMTDRVDSVRSQIDQAQGRLKLLDHLTDLATIDIAIAPLVPAKPQPKTNDGPKSIGEAFADAWAGSLEAARYVASAGAVLTVAVAWFAIPTALALLAARRFRRRTPAAGS